MLRTVARAQRETGVAITTHTHAASEGGLEQQRVFAEEGVDLDDVIIGHSGDSDDLDYLDAPHRRGSYLGLDCFGFEIMLPHDRRIATLVALCEKGMEERIVLSHDYSCHNEWLITGISPSMRPAGTFSTLSVTFCLSCASAELMNGRSSNVGRQPSSDLHQGADVSAFPPARPEAAADPNVIASGLNALSALRVIVGESEPVGLAALADRLSVSRSRPDIPSLNSGEAGF